MRLFNLISPLSSLLVRPRTPDFPYRKNPTCVFCYDPTRCPLAFKTARTPSFYRPILRPLNAPNFELIFDEKTGLNIRYFLVLILAN